MVKIWISFVLILISLTSFAEEAIKRQSGKLNEFISFDSFSLFHKNCYYALSIQHNTKKPSFMSIVAAKTEVPTYKGIINKGFIPCEISIDDYKYAVNLLWQETKKEIKTPIQEFTTGLVKKSPLLKKFEYELALASVKDPDFLKIRKEGEVKFTLGGIFNKLAINTHLFDEFIKIHEEIGLKLVYAGVEKVFRGTVAESPFKTELLAKGFRNDDRLISGAGIIYFAIK
jgi:hypothetical protein